MKLLIVVDYQNDFVDGSLGFPGAELLDEKIASIIKNYDDVIFTLDTHFDDYLETFEGKMLPVKHTIKGTKGHEVYGKVKEYLKDAKMVFEKPTFPSLELGNYLAKHPEYTEIDLCGLVSHMCVFSNAVICKAALPNALITVLKDYTDSFDKALEAKSFNVLNGLQIEVK